MKRIKLLRLLKENDRYLPYDDKSEPEKIYDFFGMSKKTFKMAVGALYKQRKIAFGKNGILLVVRRPDARLTISNEKRCIPVHLFSY